MRRQVVVIGGIVATLAPSAVLAAGPGNDRLGLVQAIGIAIVAAALLAVVFHRLRQPALLAFIAAGLALGVFSDAFAGAEGAMAEVAHLGLVFLLFIIGIEMDLRGILRLGPAAAVAMLLQAPLSIAAVYGVQALAGRFGIRLPGLGDAPESWMYYAVAASLGSTAVVVKLLADKFDLGTQAGRVTVLTLIGQDVWAVLALSWVSAQRDGTFGEGGVVTLLGGAAGLGVACFLTGEWILARVMRRLATAPDLIAVVALGWCFLWAEAFRRVGLSAEMGALAAGLTVGRLPQRIEVLAKVVSLRDFFMALFFVALGMSLPVPTWHVLYAAVALVAIVVVSRFVLFAPSLLGAGLGPIVSFAAAINLSQISEFSLLLLPIGEAAGALGAHDVATVSYALMMSAVLSTYAVPANYRLAARAAKPWLRAPAVPEAPTAGGSHGGTSDVVLLGYFLNAEALAGELAREAPELLPRVLVIDYNLRNHERIRAHGMRVAYGDVSNPDSLRHHGVGEARVVVSTISDAFLRGITNAALLDQVLALNRDARFVATVSSQAEAAELLARGAYACVVPPVEAAGSYVRAMLQGVKS